MAAGNKLFLIILLFLTAFGSLLSLEPLPVCSPFVVASSELTSLTENPSTANLNPAAGSSGISTSTSFYYGMTALNQYELTSVMDYKSSGVFASVQALDDDSYSRKDYRIGFRQGFGGLRLGIGYSVFYDDIAGYGSQKDDLLTAGMRLNIGKTTLDVSRNFYLSDMNRDKDYSESLALNIGHKLDANTNLAAGFSMMENAKTSYKLGCQYQVTDNLSLISSWSSQNGQFGIGTTFSVKWFKLAYAIQTHPELKSTHSIGIMVLLP